MIKIYTTNWCPSCNMAKTLLNEKGLSFEEINIEEKNMSRDDLKELTGGVTVPQIVINNNSIGGFDSLVRMNSMGKLEELLKS